jgi:hypothetical protein
MKFKGHYLPPGNLIMGSKKESEQNTVIDIEQCGKDIEKQTNTKMFDQPNISIWGIFY